MKKVRGWTHYPLVYCAILFVGALLVEDRFIKGLNVGLIMGCLNHWISNMRLK